MRCNNKIHCKYGLNCRFSHTFEERQIFGHPIYKLFTQQNDRIESIIQSCNVNNDHFIQNNHHLKNTIGQITSKLKQKFINQKLLNDELEAKVEILRGELSVALESNGKQNQQFDTESDNNTKDTEILTTEISTLKNQLFDLKHRSKKIVSELLPLKRTPVKDKLIEKLNNEIKILNNQLTNNELQITHQNKMILQDKDKMRNVYEKQIQLLNMDINDRENELIILANAIKEFQKRDHNLCNQLIRRNNALRLLKKEEAFKEQEKSDLLNEINVKDKIIEKLNQSLNEKKKTNIKIMNDKLRFQKKQNKTKVLERKNNILKESQILLQKEIENKNEEILSLLNELQIKDEIIDINCIENQNMIRKHNQQFELLDEIKKNIYTPQLECVFISDTHYQIKLINDINVDNKIDNKHEEELIGPAPGIVLSQESGPKEDLNKDEEQLIEPTPGIVLSQESGPKEELNKYEEDDVEQDAALSGVAIGIGASYRINIDTEDLNDSKDEAQRNEAVALSCVAVGIGANGAPYKMDKEEPVKEGNITKPAKEEVSEQYLRIFERNQNILSLNSESEIENDIIEQYLKIFEDNQNILLSLKTLGCKSHASPNASLSGNKLLLLCAYNIFINNIIILNTYMKIIIIYIQCIMNYIIYSLVQIIAEYYFDKIDYTIGIIVDKQTIYYKSQNVYVRFEHNGLEIDEYAIGQNIQILIIDIDYNNCKIFGNIRLCNNQLINNALKFDSNILYSNVYVIGSITINSLNEQLILLITNKWNGKIYDLKQSEAPPFGNILFELEYLSNCGNEYYIETIDDKYDNSVIKSLNLSEQQQQQKYHSQHIEMAKRNQSQQQKQRKHYSQHIEMAKCSQIVTTRKTSNIHNNHDHINKIKFANHNKGFLLYSLVNYDHMLPHVLNIFNAVSFGKVIIGLWIMYVFFVLYLMTYYEMQDNIGWKLRLGIAVFNILFNGLHRYNIANDNTESVESLIKYQNIIVEIGNNIEHLGIYLENNIDILNNSNANIIIYGEIINKFCISIYLSTKYNVNAYKIIIALYEGNAIPEQQLIEPIINECIRDTKESDIIKQAIEIWSTTGEVEYASLISQQNNELNNDILAQNCVNLLDEMSSSGVLLSKLFYSNVLCENELNVINNLLQNKIDLSLIVSKKLNKIEDYKVETANVELVHKKVEDQSYALENDIAIDTEFYLKNQLERELILKCNECDPNNLCIKLSKSSVNELSNELIIMNNINISTSNANANANATPEQLYSQLEQYASLLKMYKYAIEWNIEDLYDDCIKLMNMKIISIIYVLVICQVIKLKDQSLNEKYKNKETLDYGYDYFGIKTLVKACLSKLNGRIAGQPHTIENNENIINNQHVTQQSIQIQLDNIILTMQSNLLKRVNRNDNVYNTPEVINSIIFESSNNCQQMVNCCTDLNNTNTNTSTDDKNECKMVLSTIQVILDKLSTILILNTNITNTMMQCVITFLQREALGLNTYIARCINVNTYIQDILTASTQPNTDCDNDLLNVYNEILNNVFKENQYLNQMSDSLKMDKNEKNEYKLKHKQIEIQCNYLQQQLNDNNNKLNSIKYVINMVENCELELNNISNDELYETLTTNIEHERLVLVNKSLQIYEYFGQILNNNSVHRKSLILYGEQNETKCINIIGCYININGLQIKNNISQILYAGIESSILRIYSFDSKNKLCLDINIMTNALNNTEYDNNVNISMIIHSESNSTNINNTFGKCIDIYVNEINENSQSSIMTKLEDCMCDGKIIISYFKNGHLNIEQRSFSNVFADCINNLSFVIVENFKNELFIMECINKCLFYLKKPKSLQQCLQIVLKQKSIVNEIDSLKTLNTFHVSENILSFQNTSPLISSLKTDALSDRHWNQLMELFGIKFDIHSTSFTLGILVILIGYCIKNVIKLLSDIMNCYTISCLKLLGALCYNIKFGNGGSIAILELLKQFISNNSNIIMITLILLTLALIKICRKYHKSIELWLTNDNIKQNNCNKRFPMCEIINNSYNINDNIELNDFTSFKFVIDALAHICDTQSWISMKFYQILVVMHF